MYPTTLNPVIIRRDENASLASSLRNVVHKSALLNLVIVLTSFPVLVLAGGPDAVAPSLAIMAGISFVIWTVTFTLFSLISLARIFWTAISSRKPSDRRLPANAVGVSDRWLDGLG
jgi:hypothetical protein